MSEGATDTVYWSSISYHTESIHFCSDSQIEVMLYVFLANWDQMLLLPWQSPFFFFFFIPTCCPAPAESWIVSLLLSCLCVCPRVSTCLTCQCCLSLVPLYPSTRCLAGFTGHRCEQAVLKTVSDPKRMWTRLNSTTHVIAGVSPFSQKIHVFPRHGDETWAVAPGALGPVCRL